MGDARKHLGLLVRADGPIQEVMVGDYRDMQRVMGCQCFAYVPWLLEGIDCYVDDEGKLNGSPPNRAVYVEGSLVDVVFGNMLFFQEGRDLTPEECARVRSEFSEGRSGAGSGAAACRRIALREKASRIRQRLG